MAHKQPSLAVLVAITTLNPLALNIVQPALPELARAYATDYGTVQLTLALFLVASAVAQVGLGPIADRFGRRPVAIIGILVFILGSAACAFATSVLTLVAGRIVQAIGGVAGFVVSRAVIRDLYGRDAAASRLGYITMAMVVVPMLSPLVGGWIVGQYGYNGIFVFCAMVGVAALAYAGLHLSETHHAEEHKAGDSFLKSYAILLSNRAFIAHSLTIGFTSATFFTFLAGTPYLVIDLLGQSPAAYGLWWITASVTFMFGNFLAGRFGERLGANLLVRAGTAMAVFSVALLAAGYAILPAAAAVLFLATMPAWTGSGLCMPAASANALSVRPDLAGAASGLSGALQLGAGALAAFVVGHLLGDSAWPMIIIMAFTTISALVASFSAGRPVTTWRS